MMFTINKNHKKVYCLLLLLCTSCITTKYYKSYWQTDKKSYPSAICTNQDKLSIAVSNDDQNLHIKIATNNTFTVKKIMKYGLSLWVNKGNKIYKYFGIHYPLPIANKTLPKNIVISNKIGFFNEIITQGFYSNKNPILLKISELSHILPVINIDKSSFLYQLKIPFTLLNIDFNKTKEVIINIESFLKAKQEYSSSLSTKERIERELDTYKASPLYELNLKEIIPLQGTFLLSKISNKNP